MNQTLDEKAERYALGKYGCVQENSTAFNLCMTDFKSGYETAMSEVEKAAENLSHAVSACNYAQDTYLYEAAVELLQRLKAGK